MHADCTLWILFLRPGFTRVANLPLRGGAHAEMPCAPPPLPPMSLLASLADELTLLSHDLASLSEELDFQSIGLALALVAILVLCFMRQASQPTEKTGLGRTVYRLLFCRGKRLPGVLTGITFPIHAGELTPKKLTAMLRKGGHLNEYNASVVEVSDRLTRIRDGVKGDKAIIDVKYSGPTPAGLPSTFFVKFSIQKLNPMRLLCET